MLSSYFFLISDRPFGCMVGVGEAVIFFQQFKTRLFFQTK